MGSTLDLVLHAKAGALDDDGFGVVQEAIQDGRGDGTVVIKDGGPLVKGLVGGQGQTTKSIEGANQLNNDNNKSVTHKKPLRYMGAVLLL